MKKRRALIRMEIKTFDAAALSGKFVVVVVFVVMCNNRYGDGMV